MTEKFEIKENGRFGRGAFATELIRNGERILEFTGPVISVEQVLEKPADKACCTLQIGPKTYMDIQEPGVLFNHSCSPNAGIRDDKFLVAIEDILPGEEIVYDYSTTIEENDWTLQCKCGSPSCRHIVGDFSKLPAELQKRYLDLDIVQAFIRNKIQVKDI